MKKSTKRLLLAALLLGFVSSSAMAEEGKVYAAIDFGEGRAPDACTGLPANFSCNSTTTAYRFGLGYQANQNVGIEAAFLDAGNITASGTYLGVPITADITMSGYQFSSINSFPIGNEAALLLKVGLALVTAKGSASAPGVAVSTEYDNSNFTYGFGARFKANDKIAIRVMYENFGTVKSSSTDTGSEVTLLSAGLQIGF